MFEVLYLGKYGFSFAYVIFQLILWYVITWSEFEQFVSDKVGPLTQYVTRDPLY